MSFFFDVWAYEGFVLASDVRLIVNGGQHFLHKIQTSHNSKVNCAIAVCGEYPENCIKYFVEASTVNDTMKEIAERFASRWTERYAGTEDYSAVHLVGFEKLNDSIKTVPQVWYWHNWTGTTGFLSEEKLQEDLESFSQPIPINNHLPWKIKELTGKFPEPTLEDECELVLSFLRMFQPYFTWNGDTNFWRSAANAVGSAMNLLWREKSSWKIEETVQLTSICLEFLAKTGSLLPNSTVGLSHSGTFDVVTVTPDETKWVSRADLSNNP
jgi:hypothetical protein